MHSGVIIFYCSALFLSFSVTWSQVSEFEFKKKKEKKHKKKKLTSLSCLQLLPAAKWVGGSARISKRTALGVGLIHHPSCQPDLWRPGLFRVMPGCPLSLNLLHSQTGVSVWYEFTDVSCFVLAGLSKLERLKKVSRFFISLQKKKKHRFRLYQDTWVS